MVEDWPCLLEIPKGTAELGLRVTAVPEIKGVSENHYIPAWSNVPCHCEGMHE